MLCLPAVHRCLEFPPPSRKLPQDNGSGRLVAWYEAMGFRLVPEEAGIQVEDGMLARLPADCDDEFYMAAIRAVAAVYDGEALT